MGIVYLARDTRLNRPVALKLLSDRSSLDPVARADLLREGRAASPLNHPNICTVHGVEETEGQTFIVMEYVEGLSLSTAIPADGLPVELILRYAIQIADALEHAHEHGVIHRDLKSANVMVTREGRVKVLDFGLAQRAMAQARYDTTQPTASQEAHAVLAGTLPYMAPEILGGKTADAASDIWSLGVLLYEISAGALPFHGPTSFELTGAILRDPPKPLPSRVSPALRTIILRCLAKEPGQRYRRAGEVRAALEAVESAVGIAPAAIEAAVRPWYRRRIPLIASALGVSALVFGVVILRWDATAPVSPTNDSGSRLLRVVSSERRAYDSALSPDSRLIAYVGEAADARIDLFLTDARGEGQVRLTNDDAIEQRPQFSPDGTRLAFARLRPDATSEICIIPVLGGQVLSVVTRAAYPAWSPDGRRLAFVYRLDPSEPGALATANADGSNVTILLRADGAFPFVRAPAWSPDGMEIAFIRSTGGFAGELWTTPATGGPPHRLSNDPAAVFVDEPVFTSDGHSIVHSSNRGGATNLWLMPRDGGAPVRLTTGPGPDVSPSTARDGAIAFSNSRWHNVLLVHTFATGMSRTLLTHSPYLWGPAFSPDGRELAYTQGEVDGSWHVWVVPTNGDQPPRRLTSTPQGEIYPRYTPDGSSIIYHNWNEPRRIWQVPRRGGPPTLLPISQNPGDAYADISPDGKRVAFVRAESEAEHVYVALMSGGPATRLIDEPASVPRWSPDGRLIAFSPNRGYDGVFVVRPDGTGRRRVTERGGWPIWWPDSRQIAYRRVGPDGNQVVEIVPLEGGVPRRLETLRFNDTNEPIAISPDATLIATTNAVHVSDEIWLLRPGP